MGLKERIGVKLEIARQCLRLSHGRCEVYLGAVPGVKPKEMPKRHVVTTGPGPKAPDTLTKETRCPNCTCRKTNRCQQKSASHMAIVSQNLLVFYFPALDDTPVPENKKLNFSKMCCCCICGGVLSIVSCVLLAGLWSWVAGSWLVVAACWSWLESAKCPRHRVGPNLPRMVSSGF